MLKNRLRLGLTGAIHPNMPGDDSGLFVRVAGELAVLAERLDFDLSVFREPLRSEADGERARAFMDAEGVDFMMLFNASLPYGRVILPLARVRAAIGLWSVPEPTTEGVLQLNSFCGTNMLGSIISNYLREHDIRFKWFYGMPDDPQFLRRFEVTLAALRAVKTLRSARIGQIGGLADGFENLYIDERVLERRFGTTLQTRHTVEEIVARAEAVPVDRVGAEVERMVAEGSPSQGRLSRIHLEKSARIFLALGDFALEYDYDCLALSCWSRFQQIYGVAVCAAMSRQNQAGLAMPCEADVTSAIMMLALNAMNGGHSSLNDLVAFDPKDDSICLWHCGVAPACWADARGVIWENHFNIGHHEGCTWCGDGVVADIRFRPGPITIASIDNDFEGIFTLTGSVLPDKPGYSGSGGWVADLAMDGEALSLEDLMETIVTGRINHHYPAAMGNLEEELAEFSVWTGTSRIPRIGYRDSLQSMRRRQGF